MTGEAQQAMNLLQQGEVEKARLLLERYCADQPEDAHAWFTLGMINVQMEEVVSAEAHFRRALSLEPSRAVIHYNLGKTLQTMGRLPEAEACYREALRLKPDMEAAYTNLGIVLLEQDRAEEAVGSFNKALSIAPHMAELHNNLGNALRRLSRLDEANDAFCRALELKPDLVEAHESRGSLLMTLGHYNEAVKSYNAALALRPELLMARCGLAACMKELGLGFRAEAYYREVLHLDSEFVQAYIGLGRLLTESGLFEAAVENYRRVLALEPEYPSAAAELIIVLERIGDIQAAWELLQPLLQWEGRDRTAVALAFADVGRHVGRASDALQMVEGVLADAIVLKLTDRQRLLLHFAAGRLLDRCGEYDRAFEQYSLGNQLFQVDFECKDMVETVSHHIAVFSADFLRRAPRVRQPSQRPVFIVGMPRSGTSLVEQILASHPDVYGAGELEDINWMTISLPGLLGSAQPYPECVTELTQSKCEELAGQYLNRLSELAPESALRVTDKMPGNHFHLGLITMLFPQARIIHCIRDPLDTCLSCYFQGFIQANNHQYSYSLEHLGCAYRQYLRLMRHWNDVLGVPIMEVRYEDLIADQERKSRDLVAFCGLPWDDRCLRFYDSKRAVVTASYDQVRRPLYKSSVGRWKLYERHLKPLRDALSGD